MLTGLLSILYTPPSKFVSPVAIQAAMGANRRTVAVGGTGLGKVIMGGWGCILFLSFSSVDQSHAKLLLIMGMFAV